MASLAKIAAFGFGSAIGILVLGAAVNIGFAIGAWKLERLDREA